MILTVKWLLIAGLALVLGACAPTVEKPAPGEQSEQTPARDLLLRQAHALPGAVVEAQEGLVIRYPGQSLFARGALIPLAGGEEVLKPLALFLNDAHGTRWQARVSAAGSFDEDYDLRLADQRAALLQRYLHNRGIADERIEWIIEADAGAPLELRLK